MALLEVVDGKNQGSTDEDGSDGLLDKVKAMDHAEACLRLFFCSREEGCSGGVCK